MTIKMVLRLKIRTWEQMGMRLMQRRYVRLRVLRCEEIINDRREESFKEKRPASVELVEGPKWRDNNILRATKIQEGMFPVTWMEIISRIMGLFLFLFLK